MARKVKTIEARLADATAREEAARKALGRARAAAAVPLRRSGIEERQRGVGAAWTLSRALRAKGLGREANLVRNYAAALDAWVRASQGFESIRRAAERRRFLASAGEPPVAAPPGAHAEAVAELAALLFAPAPAPESVPRGGQRTPGFPDFDVPGANHLGRWIRFGPPPPVEPWHAAVPPWVR